MSHIVMGDRIGATASLSVAVSAIIFDNQRHILLTQRADNGRWCLPGGRVSPGETLPEACEREVLEETGLRVRVIGIAGMTTYPDLILEYDDGRAWQCVELDFCCEVLAREDMPRVDGEVTLMGYFSLEHLAVLDIMETDRERITRALTGPFPYF